jgi:hypothetical protein
MIKVPSEIIFGSDENPIEDVAFETGFTGGAFFWAKAVPHKTNTAIAITRNFGENTLLSEKGNELEIAGNNEIWANSLTKTILYLHEAIIFIR